MRFWDTSSVVPLCLVEPETPRVRALIDRDPALVVWWGTRTECVSALARRAREKRLGMAQVERARAALASLAAEWTEVLPGETVRDRAERLLTVHDLRAADACQLAAALLWARGQTATRDFVAFDERLREAARREGFRLLPE